MGCTLVSNNYREFLLTRSKLYNLEPISIGTVNVESLVSYVTRLAFEHNLTPNVFYNHIIVPYMLIEMEVDHNEKFVNNEQKINGSSFLSRSVATAVSDMTQIESIYKLTFTKLSDIFSPIGILKKSKCWCPLCYQDMKNKFGIVYDKLIWSFQDVKYCLIHNCELISSCYGCDSKIKPLSSVYSLDYCKKCNSWLGEKSNDTRIDTKLLEWERWVQKNLAVIFESDFLHLDKDVIIQILISLKDLCKKERVDKLENYLGISTRTLDSYISGNRFLSFNVALRLSYCISIPLKNLTAVSFPNQIRLTYYPLREKNKKTFPQKKKEIKRELLGILNNEIYSPIEDITKKFGVARASLEIHFPNLIKEIKERNLILRKQLNEIKVNERIEMIRKVTFELNKNGIFPSEIEVEKRLGFKIVNYSDNNVYYKAWIDAKKELFSKPLLNI